MAGWAGQSGGPGTSTGILADGTLCYYNYYDNQIYAVAKGPSATTVEAPLSSVTAGQSMIIQGTVSDISAGAKAKVASGEFNSVPAVSDGSMSKWMEYIYMQRPCPADATGVQVKLTATDANGNKVDIGTATSNAAGLFSFAWTPNTAGKYTINASFEGSGSYWPSSSQTAVSIAAAQEDTTETTTTTSSLEIYILAAVVLVLILMIVSMFLLRKK